MKNKEIEEFKKINDEEMEKEVENTRQTHMNDIESMRIIFLIKIKYRYEY